MDNKNYLKGILAVTMILLIGFTASNTLFSQTARNPVLEFCTGTW